jgi:hypothetical protein
MVALRHPGPLSSIDNHREEGGWTVHYYRPSHEAVLIYTPQLKKIEVASASSDVREKTSKVFAEVVLGRPPSAKPLTRREFNLERFRSSFDLDCPDLDDVEITMAAVVEAEVRLGSWGRRLNIKVTIKDKMEEVVQKYVSNSATLIRSFGFSKIAIAIGYTRRSDGKEGTFRVSISDGSSSDVQSMRDPFLRDLGFPTAPTLGSYAEPADAYRSGTGSVVRLSSVAVRPARRHCFRCVLQLRGSRSSPSGECEIDCPQRAAGDWARRG